MAKFGELIAEDKPVLIAFYNEHTMDFEPMSAALRDVAAEVGDKAKVIKINIDKNETLANALRIKKLPTYIIYKEGKMKSRTSGLYTLGQLIAQLKPYCDE